MSRQPLSEFALVSLVAGLRAAPIFAFAPPFTLVRMPTLFRALIGVALAAPLIAPHAADLDLSTPGAVATAAASELCLGLIFALSFQLLFGAIYLAGRTIDMQAGYGLALIVDPASRAQTPLVGMIIAYAAAGIFFESNGHLQLLRLLYASGDAVPVGSWPLPASLDRLILFVGATFSFAIGLGGAAILLLFIADLAIAFLARTAPQLNALVFGMQVKSILVLLALPLVIALGTTTILRLYALLLDFLADVTAR